MRMIGDNDDDDDDDDGDDDDNDNGGDEDDGNSQHLHRVYSPICRTRSKAIMSTLE